MGYNTSHWDKESHYKAKTIKQLQDELKQFQDGYAKSQEDGDPLRTAPFYTNHIEYLRMKIAERIGK